MIKPEDLAFTKNRFLVGADPEFAVVDPPEAVVPRLDTANSVEGQIGSDHAGNVWELRPTPEKSTYALTEKLARLLSSADMKKYVTYKWKSGGLGGKRPGSANFETLGGHIHFDLRNLNPAQLQACHMLNETFLNLEVFPSVENKVRCGYGSYGTRNYRAHEQTGGHVEYRCPPSWLDKPGQAFCSLTGFKLAVTEPSSIDWNMKFSLKDSFLNWVAYHAQADVDAFLLARLIERQGFGSIQADPGCDFKTNWLKPEGELWR